MRACRLLCALALAAPLPRADAASSATEYEIKGGYLYNFTNFVEWPAAAFTSADAPFVIAVLDNDHVSAVISAVLAGKRTGDGRPIRIVRQPNFEHLPSGCQLVFVSRTVPIDWAALRRQLANRPVLLVGETDGFAQHGGAINFVVAGDQVRIEINQHRAAIAGLRLSGSLASIARLVRDKADTPEP